MKEKIINHGNLIDTINYGALIKEQANTEVPSFLGGNVDIKQHNVQNIGTKPKTLTLRYTKKVFKKKYNEREE